VNLFSPAEEGCDHEDYGSREVLLLRWVKENRS
jgi:hypothetical protein